MQAPFVFGNVILNLLTSILLVVAGVGLVKLQPWGWYGSVVYGVVRIIIQIYILIFNLLYSLPITGRILEEELRSRPTLQPFAFIFQIVTPIAIASAVLGLIYPIIVLIFMSRPNVRAAFRDQPSEIEPVEDFDDEPTERLRREDGYDDEARGYGDDADDRFRPSR